MPYGGNNVRATGGRERRVVRGRASAGEPAWSDAGVRVADPLPQAEILEIPVAHACPNRLSQSSSSRGPQPAHIHLRVVTVVPLPHSELISNSSMIRRTPGRPSPRRSEEHTSELQSPVHLV